MIYKALPKKEYERIFMCNTANDVWKNLSIIHQEINQVKEVDPLEQQRENNQVKEIDPFEKW